MSAAYRQLIGRAHAHGIQVIGGTLLPSMGNSYHHPDATHEQDRQAINAWIREPGHFDAVIDFDHITADPAHPDHLRADYDSGDHLHPSPAGYRAMGEAIPLTLFGDLRSAKNGVPGAQPAPGETVLNVPLCLLLQAPEDYDHRLIRVSGTVTRGYESFALYDPRCAGTEVTGRLPGLGFIWLTYGGTKMPAGVCKCGGQSVREQPLRVDGIETHLVEDAMLKRFDQVSQGPIPAVHKSVQATLIGRYFGHDSYGMGVWAADYTMLVIQQVSAVQADPPPRRHKKPAPAH